MTKGTARIQRTGYCGAILAAGRGTRMQPFSEQYPKPLLPVCNKPIIEHQIEIMKSVGIDEIFVLIGHKGYEIAKVLGNGSRFGVSIKYVEQNTQLGIAHAVGRLEADINGPFLLMLGDIFFVPHRLEHLFVLYEEQGGGAVLGAKNEHDPEAVKKNFAINVSPDGWVTRVIEKPRHVQSTLKGVGLYLFGLSIFDAIRRTPRTALRDEYELTDAVQVMIDDGNRVRAADVVLDDINLSNPGDLLFCNLLHARRENLGKLLGPNCRVHPDARVHNSVIGANVTVENPIAIANTLIFEGSRLHDHASLNQVIVTPKFHVECSHFLAADGPAGRARRAAAGIE